jgi:lipopolysaccharide biosynthesis glycosyltransferase
VTGTVIPVVLACDDNFAEHAGVTIASLLKNAELRTSYQVHVLHRGLRPENIARLESLAALHPSSSIRAVELHREVRVPSHRTLAASTYYRLWAHEAIEADKFIYLDSDMVVTRDLSSLYATELGECYCAGVLSPGAREGRIARKPDTAEDIDFLSYLEGLGMPRDVAPNFYVNCGMLLMNAGRMRADRIETCFERTIAASDYLFAADQDVFNACTGRRKVIVDLTWNYQTSLPRVRGYATVQAWLRTQPLYAAALDRLDVELPAIIHFVRHHPWDVGSPRTRHDHLYWQYLRDTPWRHRGWRRRAIAALSPLVASRRLGVRLSSLAGRAWRRISR